MPDVQAGLTYGTDDGRPAPDPGVDAETQKHVEQIKAQSQAARQTPSDDESFSKEAIVAAFNDKSGTIEDGLRTPGDAKDQAERLDRFGRESVEWLDSSEGQAYEAEQAEIARGKTLVRMVDVVQPALEVLGESYDAEERAAALTQLSPAERELALNQGVLDPDEIDYLVQVGAQVLDQRQQVHAAMSAAISDNAAGIDRGERWETIRSEFNLSNEHEANALLMETVARVNEAGYNLGALPPQAWETAVRHTYGAIQAERIAVSHANEKNEIVRAQSASISEGLVEQGRPVVTPPVFHAKPDYRLADLLASGRTKPMTDDEIRYGVQHAHENTSVEHNVVEGGEQIPASTRAKMVELFGG